MIFKSLSTALAIAVLGALVSAWTSSGEHRRAATGMVDTTLVEVTLSEYKIDLRNQIQPGSVTFRVRNTGDLDHGFHVEGKGMAQGLKKHLSPGQSDSLTVMLAPGSYDVYCPPHRDRGMSTTITVGEKEEA